MNGVYQGEYGGTVFTSSVSYNSPSFSGFNLGADNLDSKADSVYMNPTPVSVYRNF
jgi:hypothetical protein